jgi:hypothetical protein
LISIFPLLKNAKIPNRVSKDIKREDNDQDLINDSISFHSQTIDNAHSSQEKSNHDSDSMHGSSASIQTSSSVNLKHTLVSDEPISLERLVKEFKIGKDMDDVSVTSTSLQSKSNFGAVLHAVNESQSENSSIRSGTLPIAASQSSIYASNVTLGMKK